MAATVAGSSSNSVSGYKNGVGTNALFNQLRGVVVSTTGAAYVADFVNDVIRIITLSSGLVLQPRINK